MTTQTRLKIAVGFIAALGATVIVWSTVGDGSVLNTIAGLYDFLQKNAPELIKNPAKLSEAYNHVLVYRWTWNVVFYLGLAIFFTALFALRLLFKNPK